MPAAQKGLVCTSIGVAVRVLRSLIPHLEEAKKRRGRRNHAPNRCIHRMVVDLGRIPLHLIDDVYLIGATNKHLQ
jgi:hypothetical protein